MITTSANHSSVLSVLCFVVFINTYGEGKPLFGRSNTGGFATAEHVLILGCDGFGGMYLENATSFLPNIKRFYDEGAVTTRARGQMPSVSAPNWASIITGMGPEESGIIDNDWTPMDSNTIALQLPPLSGTGKIPLTMWRAAKAQNSVIKTTSVVSWDWIHYLVEPDTVDYEFRGKENDSACAEALSRIILTHQPNLMFIHFDAIDGAGHKHGWGSEGYYEATKNVDGYIGLIFKALGDSNIMDKTLVMLTADHGGYRYDHGLFDEPNMYIPALFMGPGVKSGYKITSYTTDKDFAPTALNALGLKQGEFMVGRVVDEIYDLLHNSDDSDMLLNILAIIFVTLCLYTTHAHFHHILCIGKYCFKKCLTLQ